MYQGIICSGFEKCEALESLTITTTGVFCESRVGESKVLAMLVEESYEVGAVVETPHRTLGVAVRLFFI